MKIAELKQRKKEELEKMLSEQQERLRVLRFDATSGKVKNVGEIGKIRKTIARILTLLRQNPTV